MLKTSVGKLYTLLAACKPDNAKVQERLLIAQISEMAEYKALSVYDGASVLMTEYFAPDRLAQLKYEKLLGVKKVIAVLEDLIHTLYGVVSFGDVRQIPVMDEIDFYDANQVISLYEKVKSIPQDGVNITNIPENMVWMILEQKTVRSIQGKDDMFDNSEIEDLERVIPQKFGDTNYCISAAEIRQIRSTYRESLRMSETLKIRMQIIENKIFMKKIVVSFFATCLVPTIIYSEENSVISPAVTGGAFILYLVMLVGYWIKG